MPTEKWRESAEGWCPLWWEHTSQGQEERALWPPLVLGLGLAGEWGTKACPWEMAAHFLSWRVHLEEHRCLITTEAYGGKLESQLFPHFFPLLHPLSP